MLTTLCVRATGCFSQTMSGAASVQKGEQLEELPSADLVAGCDGVNSAAGLSCKVFVFFLYVFPWSQDSLGNQCSMQLNHATGINHVDTFQMLQHVARKT